MRSFLLPILVAGLIGLALAKGGGGGGGGGGRGGGSRSSFICKTACKSNISFMYGQAYTSIYTWVEAIAQASLDAFWLLVLVGMYAFLRKTSAVAIRIAVPMFSVSLVFLFVRYALLATETLVPTWYRFESSIAIMFWRLGYTALLVSVTGQGDLGDLSGYTTIFMQFLLAILNIAYVSLDFKLSDRAVDSFHVVKDWRLSDRDFGLTLSADGLYTLVASDGNLKALTPQYIQSKMMDIVSKGFQRARVGHLRLGVVIDLISLMIASILFTSAAMRLLKWKPCTIAFPKLFFTAASGLLLSAMFRFIITTHYVLHNWSIVTNVAKWNAWMKTYQPLDVAKGTFPASTFLKGYRVTATGFPIIQTVVEPFGIIVAGIAIVCAKRIQSKIAAKNAASVEEDAAVEDGASAENETIVESKVSEDKEASEKVMPVEDETSVENKATAEVRVSEDKGVPEKNLMRVEETVSESKVKA